MITATWAVALVVAQSVLGAGHHAPKSDRCAGCGAEKAAVVEQIVRLQTCPKWRDRDRAAHELRRFDWRCHPEVVGALALALLEDGHEEVREEAAQSLAKMGPCLPVAHEALARAAARDPDHSTRHWARKALKRLGHRCAGACTVCGPAAGGPLPAAAVVGPPAVLPPGPAGALPPPTESTAGPPALEALPEGTPAESPPKLEGPVTEAAAPRAPGGDR